MPPIRLPRFQRPSKPATVRGLMLAASTLVHVVGLVLLTPRAQLHIVEIPEEPAIHLELVRPPRPVPPITQPPPPVVQQQPQEAVRQVASAAPVTPLPEPTPMVQPSATLAPVTRQTPMITLTPSPPAEAAAPAIARARPAVRAPIREATSDDEEEERQLVARPSTATATSRISGVPAVSGPAGGEPAPSASAAAGPGGPGMTPFVVPYDGWRPGNTPGCRLGQDLSAMTPEARQRCESRMAATARSAPTQRSVADEDRYAELAAEGEKRIADYEYVRSGITPGTRPPGRCHGSNLGAGCPEDSVMNVTRRSVRTTP